MACIEEILDAEVAVNMVQLREAARLGIPAVHRGTVYRYLLGVALPDKSSEMVVEQKQDLEFQSWLKIHASWKQAGDVRLSSSSTIGLSVPFDEEGEMYSRGGGGGEDFGLLRRHHRSGSSGWSFSSQHHSSSSKNIAEESATPPLSWASSAFAAYHSLPMSANPRSAWELVVQTVHRQYRCTTTHTIIRGELASLPPASAPPPPPVSRNSNSNNKAAAGEANDPIPAGIMLNTDNSNNSHSNNNNSSSSGGGGDSGTPSVGGGGGSSTITSSNNNTNVSTINNNTNNNVNTGGIASGSSMNASGGGNGVLTASNSNNSIVGGPVSTLPANVPLPAPGCGGGAAAPSAASPPPPTPPAAPLLGDFRKRREKVMLALAALQVFYERLTFDAFIRVMELTLPMEPLYPSSKDLFFCVRALYHTLTHHQNILQDSATRQWHCGHFLMLFRAVNAPLYHHFYREQIPVVSWVPELLGSLFVGFILNREDLLLVWDAYLADVSTQNGFPLHPYVCLAILMELTEELIEMDADEIFYRLKHLPKMNIRMVLRKAIAIQQSCSGLVDDQCLCY